MTYEKAVNALVDAKLLDKEDTKAAVTALQAHSVEFTYPDWAAALEKAGLIKGKDVEKAAEVMQEAGDKEAKESGADYDDALRNAGIL